MEIRYLALIGRTLAVTALGLLMLLCGSFVASASPSPTPGSSLAGSTLIAAQEDDGEDGDPEDNEQEDGEDEGSKKRKKILIFGGIGTISLGTIGGFIWRSARNRAARAAGDIVVKKVKKKDSHEDPPSPYQP